MREGLEGYVLEHSAPAEGSEGLTVAPLAGADVQEAALLALVDGDVEREHQYQLRPEAAGIGGVVQSTVASSVTRGRLVVHRGDGAVVCEINLAFSPFPS